jgi:hypothetical protein
MIFRQPTKEKRTVGFRKMSDPLPLPEKTRPDIERQTGAFHVARPETCESVRDLD